MSERFRRAILAFDARNAADPVQDGGGPRALVESQRVSAWLERLAPDASEALRLAARCHHLERWHIPRDRYPAGRTGYLTWREALMRFHADRAAEVLSEVGYDPETVARVGELVKKKRLRRGEPEVQLLEDAVCLTFLEHEAEAFARQHPEPKVIEVLAKTLAKMGPRGRAVVAAALGRGQAREAAALSPGVLALLARALGSDLGGRAPPLADELDDDG